MENGEELALVKHPGIAPRRPRKLPTKTPCTLATHASTRVSVRFAGRVNRQAR